MHARRRAFFALADFVEPAWLPEDHVQTGVQIRMVERLLHRMLRNKLIPLEVAQGGINRIVTGITHAKMTQQAMTAPQR